MLGYRTRRKCHVIVLLLVMVMILIPLWNLSRTSVQPFRMEGYDLLLLSGLLSVVPSPNENSTRINGNDKDDDSVVHVLYCLKGSSPGFIEEFGASLRSVLLNAPTDHGMEIHLVVDDEAHKAVTALIRNDDVRLSSWKGRNPTSLTFYNIQHLQGEWFAEVSQRMSRLREWGGGNFWSHTIGAYFRLYAGHVLPNRVKHVIYVDTDAIILANLDGLWNYCCCCDDDDNLNNNNNNNNNNNTDWLFTWGDIRCSGVMVLSPGPMRRAWDLFDQVPMSAIQENMKKRMPTNDQTVLQIIETAYPHLMGPRLPPKWDVHAVGTFWENRFQWKNVSQHRPNGASFLHFNGGGGSKEAFWNGHRFYNESNHWRLASYYVDLPWHWARNQFESNVRRRHAGYPVSILEQNVTSMSGALPNATSSSGNSTYDSRWQEKVTHPMNVTVPHS